MKIMLIDFNQLVYRAFYNNEDVKHYPIDIKIKHCSATIMKILSRLNKKFTPTQIVLSMDTDSWRKKFFPYYKFNRTISPLKCTILELADIISNNIGAVYNYQLIKVDKAESDDVIATIVNKYAPIHINDTFIIVSSDKDFIQLTKYDNVILWDDKKKEQKKDDMFLFTQLSYLQGDKIDGIPNLLSDDSCLVNSNKQKSITSLIKEQYLIDPEQFVKDRGLEENYIRNKTLMELSDQYIPEEVRRDILSMYDFSLHTNFSFLDSIRYLSTLVSEDVALQMTNELKVVGREDNYHSPSYLSTLP